MWILYAFLSAFAAALVAIFAKLGLSEVEPTLATTLRSLVMAAFLVATAWTLGRFRDFSIHTLNSREWGLLPGRCGRGIVVALLFLRTA